MNETLEIKGYWFLPDAQDNRVAGTLTYIPNGTITLELIGAFHEPNDFLDSFNEQNRETSIILGESSDAKRITLIDCYSYGSLNFSCSFPIQKFSIGFVLKGIHINNKDDKAFSSITVTLPYLTRWVNSYRLRYSIPFKENRMYGFDLSFNLDDIKVIEVQLDENIKLELEYTCAPPETVHEEQLMFKQNYQLCISSKTPSSFACLLGKTSRFKTFLTLGTLNPICYETIYFYSPNHYQELENGRKYFHPIDLLYNQHHIVDATKKLKDNFLFKYDTIKDSFEAIIKRWYSFDHQMAPILKHLIESIQTKRIFNTGDFLIVVQALEGYCTRFRAHYLKKKKYITLKEQLDQLCNEYSFIPVINSNTIDIDIVANSRHYYSHFFLKKPNEHVADGVELYLLTQPLKTLLICCVLTETGFDKGSIINILNDYADKN